MSALEWITRSARLLTEANTVEPVCATHPAGHHKAELPNAIVGPMRGFDDQTYREPTYCMGDDDISRTIRLYGVWEPAETAIFVSALTYTPGIVIDFGSQIGWYSRLAENHGRLVFAVEPVTEHCELTRHNTNAVVAQHWVDASSPALSAVDAPRIACVKIDLEGAEADAIRMLSELLDADLIENILMEVSPVFNDTYPDLIRGLMRRGFAAEVCNPWLPFLYEAVDVVVAQAPQVDMMFRRQR